MGGLRLCAVGAVFLLALCAVESYGWPRAGGGYHGRGDGGNVHNHHYHKDAHNHYGGGHGGSSSSEEDDDDDHIYRLAVGNNFGPYEYIDDSDGVAKGFNTDLLVAVCAEAHKKCNWLVDRYSHCWESDGEYGYPGEGLLGDYYDGWVGYLPTAERENSLNFSMEYTKNFEAAVYYNEGSPHYTEGDPTDLTGKKIGFVSGWVWNKQCLAHQDGFKGNQKDEYTAVHFESDWSMLDALHANEIDALVAVKHHGRTKTDEELKIHAVDPAFTCSPSGLALVARYSKQDVIDWWNEAFGRMKYNGQYARLCEQAKKVHGNMGNIDCLD